jgi:cell wall-associated NlpC family hydrolase
VKGTGVDCGGLIYQVYNPHFGPFAPFPENYPADWALHNDQERYLDFIMAYVRETSVAKVVGITLFKVARAFSHAAIYIDNNDYIHAWGRPRHGSVVQTKAKVMYAMAKNGIKHFYPKDA